MDCIHLITSANDLASMARGSLDPSPAVISTPILERGDRCAALSGGRATSAASGGICAAIDQTTRRAS
jgi:hypothetical protein